MINGNLNREGLAKCITELFCAGELNLSWRSAPRLGWDGMPEVRIANKLKNKGISEIDLRLFLTYTAAMDRIRDSDLLCDATYKLFIDHGWAFKPEIASTIEMEKLRDVLIRYKVSKLHSSDVIAWRTISNTLHNNLSPEITNAIYEGKGDAVVLRREINKINSSGSLFPSLRGQKIGTMWIRIMVFPGGSNISSLEKLPVAVDVHIKRISEYMGVCNTHGSLITGKVRKIIQELWMKDVINNGSIGPAGLTNTCAALDPALWFYSKWGCEYCEKEKRKIQISSLCNRCLLGSRVIA